MPTGPSAGPRLAKSAMLKENGAGNVKTELQLGSIQCNVLNERIVRDNCGMLERVGYGRERKE